MILKFFRVLPLLVYAGIVGIIYKNKSFEEAYAKLSFFSKKAIKLLGYSLIVNGVNNIPEKGPVLFLSNHQGTIDPAVIVASCKLPLSFVSKKENEKLPILGRWAKNIGTIHFDRDTREGNIAMVRTAIRYIRENRSILIFPEGTRSKSDRMNDFKSGSLQLAYLCKADIVPITLNNAYCLDVKGANKFITITYGNVIKYEDYKNYSYEQLNSLVYKEISSKIFGL